MSQLSQQQALFLQQFLHVEPQPRGFFRTDDQKQNDRTKEAYQAYVARRQEVLGLINRLEQAQAVNGLVIQRHTTLAQAHLQVTQAQAGNPLAAEQTFVQQTGILQNLKTQVTNDLRDVQQYAVERPKVEELRRKLIAANRQGKFYEGPLTLALGNVDIQVNQNFDYAAALRLLQQATTTIYERQTRLIETDRKRDLAAARDRPVYEDKLQRVRDGLQRIRGLRGTREQQAALQRLIDEGERLAHLQPPDYAGAYKALEGLRPALAAAQKASDNFKKNVGNPKYRQALADAEQQLAAYRMLYGLVDAETVKTSEDTIDLSLRAFDGPNPPDQQGVKDEVERLTQLAKSLAKKVEKVEADSRKVTEQLKVMNELIGDLRELAPASVLQPFIERYWAARALAGNQQYPTALEELTRLRQEGTPVRTTHKDFRDRWLNRRKEIEVGAMEDIQRAISLTNRTASNLGNRLLGIVQRTENEVRDSHDYARAVEQAQLVLDGMAGLRQALLSYDGIQVELEQARTSFQRLREQVEMELQRLDAQEGDTEPARQRLEQAQLQWDSGIGELLSNEGKTVAALREAVLPELQQILEAVQNDLTVEQLQGSKDRKVARGKWQTYLKTRKAAEDGLHAVKVDDPVKAGQVLQTRPVLIDDPNLLTEQILQGIEAYKQRVLIALEENQTEVRTATQRTQRLAAGLLQDLARLEKAHPNFKPFLTSLRDEIEDCLGLVDSKALTVIVEAETRLTNVIRPKIQTLQQENGDNAPQGTKNFKAVDEKLTALKKKIKDDANLKECLPSKLAVLLYRLEKELPGECRKVTAAHALDNLLTPFETTAIDPALALALEAHNARERIARAVEVLKRRLAQLTDAPKLKASLEKRLTAASKPGENGEANALFQLDLIAKQLDAVLPGPNPQPGDVTRAKDTRSQLEQRAAEEEFKNQQAVQQWEASVRIFEHNTKRGLDEVRKNTPEGMRNETLYQAILTLFETAQKDAKAGNYVVANDRLREATSMAVYFTANPLGARATARNNLLQVNARWKEVVGKLVRDLNELREAVKKDRDASGQVEQQAVNLDQVNTTLGRVARAFDATRFEGIIGDLTNDKSNLATRRAAKEDGLRWVRTYRQQLQSDPVLAHLNANPFQKQFSLRPLAGELNNLETNLLRAP
ncbi:MAG: hypothetical protein JNM56_25565 [Planctomycetia bacterium]|nr:hypothetical protein [Planctomycetia bacterium]